MAGARPQCVLRGHATPVNTVRFANMSGEPHVLSGSADGVVKLWDLKTRRARSSFRAQNASVLHAAMCGPSGRVVTQGKNGVVRIWASLDKTERPEVEIRTGAYGFCRCDWAARGAASAGDLLLAPAARQSRIGVWDMRSKRAVHYIEIGMGRVDSGADNGASQSKLGACNYASFFSPRGGNAAAPLVQWASESGHVGFYSMVAGKSVTSAHVAKSPIMCCALTPHARGALGLAGTAQGRLATFAYDAHNAQVKCIKTVQVSDKGLSELRIRGDQRLFVMACWDRRVRVSSCKSLKPLAVLRQHTDSVFTADTTTAAGGLIASGSKDKTIAVYNNLFPPKARPVAVAADQTLLSLEPASDAKTAER